MFYFLVFDSLERGSLSEMRDGRFLFFCSPYVIIDS